MLVGSVPTTPVTPGQRTELADDDRIYVGAWTRLVIRKVVDDYPGAVTIGEVWVMDNMLWAEYLRPDELHLGFNSASRVQLNICCTSTSQLRLKVCQVWRWIGRGKGAEAPTDIERPALREAIEEAGREQRYRLNAGAMARMYHDWFARFAPIWDTALENLKTKVEAAAPAKRRRA